MNSIIIIIIIVRSSRRHRRHRCHRRRRIQWARQLQKRIKRTTVLLYYNMKKEYIKWLPNEQFNNKRKKIEIPSVATHPRFGWNVCAPLPFTNNFLSFMWPRVMLLRAPFKKPLNKTGSFKTSNQPTSNNNKKWALYQLFRWTSIAYGNW